MKTQSDELFIKRDGERGGERPKLHTRIKTQSDELIKRAGERERERPKLDTRDQDTAIKEIWRENQNSVHDCIT